jgi:hypothetical protein
MDQIYANRPTDEQLEGILHEVAIWTVNGPQGRVLGVAPSLRGAVEKSRNYAQSGAVVVSISRLPRDNLVVFPSQIDRLRRVIADRETPAIMETGDWVEAGAVSA